MATLRLDKEKGKCSFENASVEKSKSSPRNNIAWSKDCIYFKSKFYVVYYMLSISCSS